MLQIKDNKVEADGSIYTQLTDYMMLTDYIMNRVEEEFGAGAKKRFAKKLNKVRSGKKWNIPKR